jgi:hypothetical protein
VFLSTNNLANERTLVEQHVAESKAQIRNGQLFGPFDSADEAIESLHPQPKTESIEREARA